VGDGKDFDLRPGSRASPSYRRKEWCVDAGSKMGKQWDVGQGREGLEEDVDTRGGVEGRGGRSEGWGSSEAQR